MTPQIFMMKNLIAVRTQIELIARPSACSNPINIAIENDTLTHTSNQQIQTKGIGA